jgi:arginase
MSAFHAILAPFDLDQLRSGSGSGPEALAAHNVLGGLNVRHTTSVELTAPASSQIQHCIALDAAIAATVRQVRNAGDVPIVFAGNCHTCLGTLSGIGSRTSIIWFDAHGDLNTPDTTETGYFDGMALGTALGWGWHALARRIPGFNAANESDTVLIGGRDLDAGERALLQQSRIVHYAPPPLAEAPSRELTAVLAEPSRPRPAYVHLDLDIIDPSRLHANRFNVPGGVSISWLEDALGMVRRRHDVAAVAVTAYDPSYAPPEAAAPLVNRLLRALLHTVP